MLKIKDSVDLKELEKFGFEGKVGRFWLEKEMDTLSWFIHTKTRIIEVSTDNDAKVDTTLFDLIQAGLVEKCENKIIGVKI